MEKYFDIYLYNKDLNLQGIFVAPSQKEFEANMKKFCDLYVPGENYISYVEIKNPVVEDGTIREMKNSELIATGKLVLADGQYLDNEEIKTIEKPNSYSIWDNENHTWNEDKSLKLQYLKDNRYSKQQEFLKNKHELEEKENEKTEFEDLGFDTSETEDKIEKIKAEMDKLKTEILALSKDIKALEKEVK